MLNGTAIFWQFTHDGVGLETRLANGNARSTVPNVATAANGGVFLEADNGYYLPLSQAQSL